MSCIRNRSLKCWTYAERFLKVCFVFKWKRKYESCAESIQWTVNQNAQSGSLFNLSDVSRDTKVLKGGTFKRKHFESMDMWKRYFSTLVSCSTVGPLCDFMHCSQYFLFFHQGSKGFDGSKGLQVNKVHNFGIMHIRGTACHSMLKVYMSLKNDPSLFWSFQENSVISAYVLGLHGRVC